MSKRVILHAALLASVSIYTSSAFAQDAESQSSGETVIVTGSRISRPGFEAPTPVTAITSADITKSASTTIADVLNDLPQFGLGTGPHTGFQGGGNAGANFINLRNLGTTRTLVLLNGERVVSSALTNSVDLNTLPNFLIQRVDVVTGGASAAWGSDAVAGVVNLIVDTHFDSLKADAQYGNNGQSIYETYKADAAYGFDFDGDRGHLVASVSYFDSPNATFVKQAPWNQYQMLMNNPAFATGNGQPKYIHVTGAGLAQATQGGLITAGPLKNTQFVGSNATPTPFNPGFVSGTLGFGGTNDSTILGNNAYTLPELGYNFYTYGSYKLTSDITAHIELDHGYDSGQSFINPYLHNANVTIQSDNPFIPTATKAQMNALGLSSFQFGSLFNNIGNPKNGGGVYTVHRTLQRGTFGLDGALPGGWTWSAYYEHGENHNIERWLNDPYIPNFNNALDAVTVTSANVGSSGLPVGSVACRSTLANPANGCSPLNPFGVGNASAAAIKYIQPVAFYQTNNRQDVAEATIQGEPFDIWAGPVSIAGGVGYRSESADANADALSYSRQYYVGNSQPFHGAVNVYEGFMETDVPLAKDEFWAKSLNFNAAGRVTDYSTSGVVETWKLGLIDQIGDEYRLRATWSSDIRAPNLSELFTKASSGGRVINDPFTGQSPLVLNTNTGNPNLKPEDASTVSGGIVYTPSWLEGLSVSLDYYHISIHGAIATTPQENELANCFAGQTVFCSLVKRNAAGTITEIVASPQNTAELTNSGFDLEAQYSMGIFDGILNLHAVSNYTDESVSSQSGVLIDNAGSISANTLGGAGLPKFKATLTATYSEQSWSATVQSRLLSSGRLNNYWGPLDVDDNTVPWVAYADLRGTYNLDEHWQAYFAVDNVFDTPPPNVPYLFSQAGQIYMPPSPGNVYDLLGRQYRVGVRVDF